MPKNFIPHARDDPGPLYIHPKRIISLILELAEEGFFLLVFVAADPHCPGAASVILRRNETELAPPGSPKDAGPCV
jgi:hypothetical protein